MSKKNIHIIKNNQYNRQFLKDGFLLMDLLDTDTLDELQKVYDTFEERLNKVDPSIILSATQDCEDANLYETIDQKVKNILLPVVEKHFVDYQPLIGAFLIKRVGNDTYMNLHQDWNLTDESRFLSFNIWIPLKDIDEENGCLQFLPGSQEIVATIRPNYKYDWAFRNVVPFMERRLVNVFPKKGQCVLINHAVVHSSEVNRKNTPRVAAFLTLIPKDAPILHYFSEDKENVEVYHIKQEEFYKIKYQERPSSPIIEKFKYPFPTVSEWYMFLWYYLIRIVK